MMFHTRWLLPVTVAGSLLMACGSSGGGGGGGGDASTTDTATMGDTATNMDSTSMGDGGGGDGGGNDASGDRPADATGDRPADARPDVASANPCAAPTDLSMRMAGADGAIHVTGDITANDNGQIGDLTACRLMADTKINTVVYSYTMRAAGFLQVSTDNAGTDEGLDTIVAVLPMCSATAAALVCNDDIGNGMLHSRVTTGMLAAGRTVFVVVGTYGRMGGGDQEGAYELTVRETQPGVANGPCRTTAPFCDMALQCSVAAPSAMTPGTCVMPVAVGMPCTATSVCITGSACIANPGSTTMGTCRADGTVGGRCRTAAGMMACDMGLACTARMPTAMATGVCRTAVMAGGECDATAAMNACVSGTSCRPSPTTTNPTRTVCVADGAQGGLCRTDSPRCDMSLECSSATPATCRAAAMAGGMCDLSNVSTFCPSGATCAPNAMFNAGTCATNGTAAGTPCRDAAPRCDTGLSCSTDTGAGFCRRDVPAGMPCDVRYNSTTCAMSGLCLSSASGATSGTCTATTAEMEPNNTPMTGNGPVTATTIFRGSLTPGSDIDCYRFTLPMGGRLTAFTSDATGTTCNLGMGGDTTLQLNDSTGSEIATNDDFMGRGLCSEINPMTDGATMLAAGNYSLCVGTYQPAMGDPVAIASYYLTVRITTP